MTKFDHIRPYFDSEVNQALRNCLSHPMMKSLMEFTFPNKDDKYWKSKLRDTHSIETFQTKIVYQSIKNVLERSSEGLTTSGFDQLDNQTPYLFISNHRDIILDTSLLNVKLFENGHIMTASAIGDNLVQKEFLLELSKLNRNFLVQRSLAPRELLQSSQLMSQYIAHLISNENRSVWIAQREGRTKDGNDVTHQGVIKMLAMAREKNSVISYLKKLKIVPVSISYEYDPTDALKLPQLIALEKDQDYVKGKNEDFINLISGILGQKKRIHIHVDKVIDRECDFIESTIENPNKQIQAFTQVIDDSIHRNYKLWPTNYIAFDLLYKTNEYTSKYNLEEKDIFQRRLEMRIDANNSQSLKNFLNMYANPVVNQMKLINADA